MLSTTREHPFYTRELCWGKTDNLWKGAHARKLDASYGTVESVWVEQTTQSMYNLTVVVEIDAATGKVLRTWKESYAPGGNMIRVHPKGPRADA